MAFSGAAVTTDPLYGKGTCHAFYQRVLVQEQTAGRRDISEETMMNESSRKVRNIWLQNKQLIYEAANI